MTSDIIFDNDYPISPHEIILEANFLNYRKEGFSICHGDMAAAMHLIQLFQIFDNWNPLKFELIQLKFSQDLESVFPFIHLIQNGWIGSYEGRYFATRPFVSNCFDASGGPRHLHEDKLFHLPPQTKIAI